MESINQAVNRTIDNLKSDAQMKSQSGGTSGARELSTALQPSAELSDREKRERVCEQILALFYAAYGRDPLQGMERNIKVAAWRMALADVPVSQIMPLAELELKNRTNKFLPTPADLLARWKGEEVITDEDGKPERVVAANAAAYALLQPTENELAYREEMAKRALPSAPEHRDSISTDGKCYCESCESLRKRMAKDKQRGKVEPVKVPRITPTDEKALGMALSEYLHMEPWRVPRETWARFGWWLLSVCSVEEWTPELGRSRWAEFHQQQKAEAQVEAVPA